MTTFNIDTAADDRELTAEELEIVAGGGGASGGVVNKTADGNFGAATN